MSDLSKHNEALSLALTCPISEGVLRWWASHVASLGTLPSMQEFEVLKFPKALSSLAVFVFDEGRHDYVCRLAGEMVNASHHTTLKNSILSEVYDSELATKIRSEWNRTFDAKKALCVMAKLDHPSEALYSWRHILPVYTEGTEGRVILSLSVYSYDAAYYHEKYPKKIYQEYELSVDDILR
ncbi:hypothetical protein [Kiloniella majae]|uniref:hypothetical protein n=1 Tax=Kiloniella majae TaxID=1938558 RepID=UPI000F76A250|nr:hypothetical protein [Kiloniella majae]